MIAKRTRPDIEALRAEFAGQIAKVRREVAEELVTRDEAMAAQRGKTYALAAELAAVRRLLHDNGIAPPAEVPPGYITMSDAAKLIHRSYDAIRKRVERGKLDSLKVGDTVFVKMSALSGLSGQ